MKFLSDTILVMTSKPTYAVIENNLNEIPGLSIVEAKTEAKAFELIYTHNFVLIIVEDNLPEINLYSLGAMLMSHKKIHNAPLLVIKHNSDKDNFLKDFTKLQIDYLYAPFSKDLILAKIKIFYDLHQVKTAVSQSLEELDNAYRKMIRQNDSFLKEDILKKKPETALSLAANQIQPPMQSLLSDVYQLLGDKKISGKSKPALLNLKTCAERINQIAKQYLHVPRRSIRDSEINPPALDLASPIKMICAEPSDEDFRLFSHFLKNYLFCILTRAGSIEECLELLAKEQHDIIITAHHFPDGTGLQLLSRLRRIQPETPVIFNINQVHADEKNKILSKGAFACFIKENLSSKTLVSEILNTFEKAKITQESEDARDRIVLISQKDSLTRLYNRRSFEKKLDHEMSAAGRYNTRLSLIMLHFNLPGFPSKGRSQSGGDLLLSTSAALIQSIIRDTDMICRFDKNRFALLLPHTSPNGAKVLAKRIQTKIDIHHDAMMKPGPASCIKYGIAAYDPEDPTTASRGRALIQAAIDKLGLPVTNEIKTINSK